MDRALAEVRQSDCMTATGQVHRRDGADAGRGEAMANSFIAQEANGSVQHQVRPLKRRPSGIQAALLASCLEWSMDGECVLRTIGLPRT